MMVENLGGLRWVVALPSEAAPLLARFAMKLVHAAPFKVYRSGDAQHWLVLSGMGKVAAAGACAHLQAVSSASKAEAWLNVGIAGHQSAPLGTGFLVHKATDVATGSTWYPGMSLARGLASCSLETVDRPQMDYAPRMLYDMEAAGYFAMATKFSSLALSQSMKVVSDNADEAITKINRERVTGWIESALPTIERVAERLLDLSAEEHSRLDAPVEMNELLERWRFSVSQQHEVKKLLIRWHALSSEDITEDEACMSATDSKALLKVLRAKLEAFPAAMGEL